MVPAAQATFFFLFCYLSSRSVSMETPAQPISPERTQFKVVSSSTTEFLVYYYSRSYPAKQVLKN